MSRVMICHCDRTEEQALRSAHDDLVRCEDNESLFDEVAAHSPDVVVYGLRPDSESDLALLKLFRRAAPQVALVVVGGGEDPGALRGAVQSALSAHALN